MTARSLVFLLSVVLLSSALLLPVRAAAQQGGDYVELEALIVEGQIQRPQAVYIIQRAGLDFGALAKRKSFVDKIEESIREDPF